MHVHKGGCGSTHSCLVSVDALLLLPLERQGVKGRMGAVKSPVNHNLPYGDDLYNATRSAWTPMSDPLASMSCLHQFTSLTAFARTESVDDSSGTPDCSAMLFIFNTRWWSTHAGLVIMLLGDVPTPELVRGLLVGIGIPSWSRWHTETAACSTIEITNLFSVFLFFIL